MVRLDGAGDPWAPILAAADAELVCAHVEVGDEEIEGVFETLNLGRDHLVRLSLSLVLWIGGADRLESLQRKAPDLWAYRRRVGVFASAEDFIGDKIAVAPEDALDVQQGRVEATLALLRKDDPRQPRLLLDLAHILELRCNYDAALSCITLAESSGLTYWLYISALHR
ncbi:MAG: hypothetical protein KC457_17870, partial [Myxococcales bacterium]|nr:hypothetical protein [Myxococcales bacterium]